jgi:hypothetical protein
MPPPDCRPAPATDAAGRQRDLRRRAELEAELAGLMASLAELSVGGHKGEHVDEAPAEDRDQAGDQAEQAARTTELRRKAASTRCPLVVRRQRPAAGPL